MHKVQGPWLTRHNNRQEYKQQSLRPHVSKCAGCVRYGAQARQADASYDCSAGSSSRPALLPYTMLQLRDQCFSDKACRPAEKSCPACTSHPRMMPRRGSMHVSHAAPDGAVWSAYCDHDHHDTVTYFKVCKSSPKVPCCHGAVALNHCAEFGLICLCILGWLPLRSLLPPIIVG